VLGHANQLPSEHQTKVLLYATLLTLEETEGKLGCHNCDI